MPVVESPMHLAVVASGVGVDARCALSIPYPVKAQALNPEHEVQDLHNANYGPEEILNI